MPSRAQAVHRLASNLGFTLLGIAPAEPSPHADHIHHWLAAGRHGDMAYIKEQLEERLDPRKLLPGAKSIICVADRYGEAQKAGSEERRAKVKEPRARNVARRDASSHTAPPPAPLAPLPSPPAGRIARYAHGPDYHRVIKKRLHALADALRERWPEHEYRSCVDTAPILEREYAARAGLGWIAKNTLLIHPVLGSYLLLGEIVTTLPLQPSREAANSPPQPGTDHCGTCTRCLDACPTHCITPYTIDASRCVSYLTLEHRGPIPPALHEPMGDWIAGCDVCQEVCPFNESEARGEKSEGRQDDTNSTAPSPAPLSPPPSPLTPHSSLPLRSSLLALHSTTLPLLEVLQWDAAARREAFARSALKRLKLDQLKRNALILAGNHLARHDDTSLLRRVEALAADPAEPDLVRLTARQVLDRVQHRFDRRPR